MWYENWWNVIYEVRGANRGLTLNKKIYSINCSLHFWMQGTVTMRNDVKSSSSTSHEPSRLVTLNREGSLFSPRGWGENLVISPDFLSPLSPPSGSLWFPPPSPPSPPPFSKTACELSELMRWKQRENQLHQLNYKAVRTDRFFIGTRRTF